MSVTPATTTAYPKTLEFFDDTTGSDTAITNGSVNKLFLSDHPIHDWYRFVLSFPAHLVRDYLQRWQIGPSQRVLDPFCGTGSTLVEAKKLGIPSVGIEANPAVHFAASTKVNWSGQPDALLAHAEQVAALATKRLASWGSDDKTPHLTLPPGAIKLLLTDSMSPLPLHKTLVLHQCMAELAQAQPSVLVDYGRLALIKTAVATASNLRFGPEVGVSTKKKTDAPVIEAWLDNVREMASDLRLVAELSNASESASESVSDATSASAAASQVFSQVIRGDARDADKLIPPASIDAVFTSPPYPNEKDYSRTTRLETVLLGFASDKAQLRAIKQGLLRSNTRNVYQGDSDDTWVEDNPVVQQIAQDIEKRRIELGKTSGFERLYARVTKLYFGGMARHLAALRPLLKPGAHLGYVVGDQASYLRVKISTGEILGEIAQTLGYELVAIDLFRTRFATVTREMMREEVVVLRWPG